MSLQFDRENRLVKIKFAVCKIFKQILHKNPKLVANNNNYNNHLKESSGNKINRNCSCANEIEQNQANERILKSKASQPEQKKQEQQPAYALALETAVGSFYWHWECGMQRDSFADFNFSAH